MSRIWLKGEFIPQNKEKYIGKGWPTYRSSWELEFMSFLDNSNAIIEWASEPTFGDNNRGIPYFNMVKGRQSLYIPDFLITFKTTSGQIKSKMIEIKPLHEAVLEYCRNEQDELTYIVNKAKWEAAEAWCSRRENLEFQVLTERELFPGNYKPPVKKQKVSRKKP